MLKYYSIILSVSMFFGINCAKLPMPKTLPSTSLINASDGTSSDYVGIRWNTVSGAKKYYIYRSDAINGQFSKIGISSTDEYFDYNVVLQQTYFYKIAAIGYDSSEGKQSSIDSGYSDVSPSVYNLTASNGTSTDTVYLSWKMDQKGSVFYKVYRAETEIGTYELISEPAGLNYNDITAICGKPYFYKVQGVSQNGNIGEMSNFDSGYIALSAPTLSATKGSSTSSIAISWSNISLASTYSLSRSPTKDGVYTTIYTGSANSFIDTSTEVTGNNASTDYYYQIFAISSYNLAGFTSSTDYGYAALPPPTSLQATDGTLFNKIELTWPNVNSVNSYNIYRKTPNGQYTLITTTSETIYQDLDVSYGIVYSYKVVAVKNGHETSFSPEDTGYSKDPTLKSKFNITWKANRQRGVNQTGGGYKIYYSKDPTFSNYTVKDVPYESGNNSPTTAVLEFDSTQTGKWYIRITAYAYFSNIKESVASDIYEITVK
jgi:fibronectin type 3 domain-containing protein